MKTLLEVAREEARRAHANAERARSVAEHASQSLAPSAPVPSGAQAMALAAVHSASEAAMAASEAATHTLSVAEAEDGHPPSLVLEAACRAISKSLRATIQASQAATAAMGVSSALPGTATPPTDSPGTGDALQGEKRCAFCGRPEDATRLVAGPQVSICEECVRLCAGILGLDVVDKGRP